jgi:hypothetical protein
MGNSEPSSIGPVGGRDDSVTHARLAAIESHLQQVESLLIGISKFDNRLDQINATLELAIGVLAPGHSIPSITEQQPRDNSVRQGHERRGYRIVVHLSREGHGTRLVTDVSWSDMWSVRLYVTALLRNAVQSGIASAESRYWCEVWTPDETGKRVDSAHLDSDTGVIEWESDMETGE